MMPYRFALVEVYDVGVAKFLGNRFLTPDLSPQGCELSVELHAAVLEHLCRYAIRTGSFAGRHLTSGF